MSDVTDGIREGTDVVLDALPGPFHDRDVLTGDTVSEPACRPGPRDFRLTDVHGKVINEILA